MPRAASRDESAERSDVEFAVDVWRARRRARAAHARRREPGSLRRRSARTVCGRVRCLELFAVTSEQCADILTCLIAPLALPLVIERVRPFAARDLLATPNAVLKYDRTNSALPLGVTRATPRRSSL
eukprot:1818202-Prymnesium_polylepis.1